MIQKIFLLASMCILSGGTLFSPSCYARTKKHDHAKKCDVIETEYVHRWRKAQGTAKNAVVQIFSMIAEFDWLEPYRTPYQYQTCGSGFILDIEACGIGQELHNPGTIKILTNAHVVHEAVAVYIQVLALGKKFIKAHILGVCPERDLAMLEISEEDSAIIWREVEDLKSLRLGNSDAIAHSDEVLAMGYPLGFESLKSTMGVVSGWQDYLIQIDAATNPGNSGGPLLNIAGEVIGVNNSSIRNAQNMNYAIPSNIVYIVLAELLAGNGALVRKPILGIAWVRVTDHVTEMLGNPLPGGCYIIKVLPGSVMDRAGLQDGDQIYIIDGNIVDLYGDMSVPWTDTKTSIMDYAERLMVGHIMHVVFYRKSERHEINVPIEYHEAAAVKRWYPWHEEIDYEVFGGFVVMPLTVNHMELLKDSPGLQLYTIFGKEIEPHLVITHIFSNSLLAQARSVLAGFTVTQVNDTPVATLAEFRAAVAKSQETGSLVMSVTDQKTLISDIPVVLPFDQALDETVSLSYMYHYPLSAMTKKFLNKK
ncbi:MAG TPA: trypsin-like peptidase domain-containing protein [Candidatus Bathyarchaeia archaeon]|nr:trypsin-like peptidase domain-containing protein [Candidatus Bathyarchaeia archaeon]